MKKKKIILLSVMADDVWEFCGIKTYFQKKKYIFLF